MTDKVKISGHLLVKIISLLEDLDVDDISHDCLPLYGYVLYSLKKKKDRLLSDYGYSRQCDDDLPF